MEIIRKSSEHIKACFDYLWAMFTVNIIKRITQKLRRIILLHFKLITVRIYFGKNRTLVIVMIFRFGDASMAPNTKYFNLWEFQISPNRSRKRINFWEISFWEGNLKSLDIVVWGRFGKARAQNA